MHVETPILFLSFESHHYQPAITINFAYLKKNSLYSRSWSFLARLVGKPELVIAFIK